MIEIFGIGFPESLFYSLIIAGSIFYCFTIYIILQIIRRRMPTRIMKLTLGQGLSMFKATVDDLKIYWKEGWKGKPHEVWKITKERLMPHWGVTNQIFLVREDYKLTVPFAKVYPKVDTKLLCNNCKKLATNMVNSFSGLTKTKDNKYKVIETEAIDVSKLCNKCQPLFYTLDSKDIEPYLCEDCIGGLPEAITVDFATTDELRGSSTEAHERRKNEEFVRTVARESKKLRRGELIIGFIMAIPVGMIVMMGLLIATGVIKLL